MKKHTTILSSLVMILLLQSCNSDLNERRLRYNNCVLEAGDGVTAEQISHCLEVNGFLEYIDDVYGNEVETLCELNSYQLDILQQSYDIVNNSQEKFFTIHVKKKEWLGIHYHLAASGAVNKLQISGNEIDVFYYNNKQLKFIITDEI